MDRCPSQVLAVALSGRGPYSLAHPVNCQVRLKLNLEVVGSVERFVGVEEARSTLGRLAEDVAGGDEVWLTKRGRPLAVLVGRDEFNRLRTAASQAERAELARRLADARQRVAEAGLDPAIIDEAFAAVRPSA